VYFTAIDWNPNIGNPSERKLEELELILI